jgi:hypothetical protein
VEEEGRMEGGAKRAEVEVGRKWNKRRSLKKLKQKRVILVKGE